MKTKNFFGKGISSIEGTDWKFNKNISNNFDKHVRQSIPMYDDIQKYICSLCEWFLKDGSNIYDLGCSTGETPKNLFLKFPKKKINYIGYDLSQEMIKIAKKKNIKYSKKTKFITANILKTNYKKNTDLFLSILTFPFLNSENRINLFKKIYKSLKFGGALIFVDKIRSSNSNIEDILNQIYFDFKIENKLNPSQILNKSKSIRSSMEIFELKEIESFLTKSGFKKSEIFFRWFNFIGIIAIK
jgi:tRNA (cmo5U34)-methyltransferase